MDISVLISTYKRNKMLESALKSLCIMNKSDIKWELIVVDNYGDRKTEKLVSEYTKRLPIRYLIKTKGGKNYALNEGIKEARGELLIFTDDDVKVDKKWLIESWEGVHRWPRNHVFGGKCLPIYPKNTKITFDHWFFENAFTIANWDIPEGTYGAEKVYGPNMAIRASVFQNGWRFDSNYGPDGTERYLMGGETELTLRLEKAGFEAIYLPKSIVYHQIREEQMEYQWLLKRAFRSGREDARIKINEIREGKKLILYVFIFSVKKMARASIEYMSFIITKNEKRKFDKKLIFWHAKGMIYQFKKSILKFN